MGCNQHLGYHDQINVLQSFEDSWRSLWFFVVMKDTVLDIKKSRQKIDGIYMHNKAIVYQILCSMFSVFWS